MQHEPLAPAFSANPVESAAAPDDVTAVSAGWDPASFLEGAGEAVYGPGDGATAAAAVVVDLSMAAMAATDDSVSYLGEFSIPPVPSERSSAW